jgi:hypothetical protein
MAVLNQMTVLGLLLTMTDDRAARERAVGELARWPGVELGPPHSAYQPLTLEAASPRAAREALRRLEALEGVALVQLVRAYWVEPSAEPVPKAAAERSDHSLETAP